MTCNVFTLCQGLSSTGLRNGGKTQTPETKHACNEQHKQCCSLCQAASRLDQSQTPQKPTLTPAHFLFSFIPLGFFWFRVII